MHFNSFSNVHIEDQKKNEYDQEYHNHTLQTKTRPDIIMHFIKQRNQFHFERKLYAQKCVSVSEPFVPNVVVEHVGVLLLVVLRRHTTSGKIHPTYG